MPGQRVPTEAVAARSSRSNAPPMPSCAAPKKPPDDSAVAPRLNEGVATDADTYARSPSPQTVPDPIAPGAAPVDHASKPETLIVPSSGGQLDA